MKADAMDDDYSFDEETLFACMLGDATPEMQAQLARSPAAQAALAQLTQQLTRVYRLDCPAPTVLVAFQERRIVDSALQLTIHHHVAVCPYCAEELVLLAQIDTVPLDASPAPVRRVVEALFQSPLARVQALRGDLLLYTTPRVAVHLRVRQELDQPGAWTVRGQLRLADGSRAVDLLHTAQASSRAGEICAATVERAGAFRFAQLGAGTWMLTLHTAEEAIVIHDVAVGDDDTVPLL